MSKVNLVGNMHLDKECSYNTKIGFQSSKTSSTTQTNIRNSMSLLQQWYADGKIKDGSVIRIYMKINVTKEAQAAYVPEVEVDGEVISFDAPAAAPADDTDDIPF